MNFAYKTTVSNLRPVSRHREARVSAVELSQRNTRSLQPPTAPVTTTAAWLHLTPADDLDDTKNRPEPAVEENGRCGGSWRDLPTKQHVQYLSLAQLQSRLSRADRDLPATCQLHAAANNLLGGLVHLFREARPFSRMRLRSVAWNLGQFLTIISRSHFIHRCNFSLRSHVSKVKHKIHTHKKLHKNHEDNI